MFVGGDCGNVVRACCSKIRWLCSLQGLLVLAVGVGDGGSVMMLLFVRVVVGCVVCVRCCCCLCWLLLMVVAEVLMWLVVLDLLLSAFVAAVVGAG